MANENGQEKRETLADIVAEMRRRIAVKMSDAWYTQDEWRNLCDRLEAAWKREKAEWESAACSFVSNAVMSGRVAVEHVPVGNAAAMREAVVALLDAMHSLGCDEDTAALAAFVPGMEDSSAKCLAAFRKANAALSAPARNCDRFNTMDEARQSFQTIRGHAVWADIELWDNKDEIGLFVRWLFASAAERKGEPK